MWTKKADDTLLWSLEAKLALVEEIKRHSIVLSDASSSKVLDQKEKAWNKVYKGLIHKGMPDTTIPRIKKVWGRMRKMSDYNHAAYKRQLARNPKSKTNKLSKLDQSIIAVIQSADVDDWKYIMPKPMITPKVEKPDENDENVNGIADETISDTTSEPTNQPRCSQTSQRQRYLSRCEVQTTNPIVVLDKLQSDGRDASDRGDVLVSTLLTRTATETVPASAIRSSDTMASEKYWTLMEKVAENEIKFKLSQRENEEERMEFARDLHRKNMILLDLKIKVQAMQIEAMRQPSEF